MDSAPDGSGKAPTAPTVPAVLTVLAGLTGAGVALQWLLIAFGAVKVDEKVPGFTNYYLSFWLADLWLVLCAAQCVRHGIARQRRASILAAMWGAALSSVMIFFGAFSLVYDIRTGLFGQLSSDELFGKFVTLWNLGAGVGILVLSGRWLLRDTASPGKRVVG